MMNFVDRGRPPLLARLAGNANRFACRAASAIPLGAFRIGVASVLLLQGLALVSDVEALYGPTAVVRWEVLDPSDGPSVVHPFAPRVRVIADVLAPLGVNGEQATQVVFFTYLMALTGLLIGWKTRLSAVVAWLTHYSLSNAAAATIYGVDLFAHISLFYCVVFPVGGALSLDATERSVEPASRYRLALRVLQLHLCVVYFTSAIEKGVGEQWWNGEAIWRAVTLPGLAQFDMTWLAAWPAVAVLAGWGTLATEAGYAFLIWPRRTRVMMALATIGMHVGIGVVMGLTSFSALMIVLTAAAFLAPAEPKAVAVLAVRLRRGVLNLSQVHERVLLQPIMTLGRRGMFRL